MEIKKVTQNIHLCDFGEWNRTTKNISRINKSPFEKITDQIFKNVKFGKLEINADTLSQHKKCVCICIYIFIYMVRMHRSRERYKQRYKNYVKGHCGSM